MHRTGSVIAVAALLVGGGGVTAGAVAYSRALAVGYESVAPPSAPAPPSVSPSRRTVTRTPTANPTVTPKPRPKPLMARGSTGTDVRELQVRLKRAGVFRAGVTGFYGRVTEQAVRRYQQRRGFCGHR
jgi:hypothetical protein